MYLSLLTPQQRQLFAVAAQCAIQLDEKHHDSKAALLDAISVEAQLDELPKPVAVGDVLGQIRADDFDAVQRRAFVLELYGVVLVDLDETDEERKLVGAVAERLLVTEELPAFRTFASDARALVARGRELLTTEA